MLVLLLINFLNLGSRGGWSQSQLSQDAGWRLKTALTQINIHTHAIVSHGGFQSQRKSRIWSWRAKLKLILNQEHFVQLRKYDIKNPWNPIMAITFKKRWKCSGTGWLKKNAFIVFAVFKSLFNPGCSYLSPGHMQMTGSRGSCVVMRIFLISLHDLFIPFLFFSPGSSPQTTSILFKIS